MNKKGFISQVTLVALSVITSQIALIHHHIECSYHVVNNIKIANETIKQEIIVINDIKCKLRNKQNIVGSFSVNNISYNAHYENDILLVFIQGLKEERMEIIILEDKIIEFIII